MGATYLTVGQVAQQLNISRWTLRRAAQRGDLRATGRTPGGWLQFAPAEVERYARRLAPPLPTVWQATVPAPAEVTPRRGDAAAVARPRVSPDPVANLGEADAREHSGDADLLPHAQAEYLAPRAQAEHLALVLRSLPCGLVAVDASGQITLINEAAMRLGGGAGASDAGPPPRSSTLHTRVSALLARALAGEPAPLADSAVLAAAADAPRMVRMRATALTDSAGAINGATALLFDDDERAAARAAAPRAYAAGQAHANRALARSNSELEKFASVASHDLQEPLRKIRTFGDRLTIVDGAALSPAGADYLARMQHAAARMQVLIDDLLAYARVSADPPRAVPVDLAATTRAVLADLETRIEQSGGRVEVGPLPTIEGDPLRLRQLLQNLISNALKFQRPEAPPVVTISATLLPSEDAAQAGPLGGAAPPAWLHLSVRDNGIGFEPKHATRIFEVFKRLHGRGAYEGTGIGLALCRQIAERHGGHISATGALGQGATVHVTLPLHHAHGGETP